MALTDTLRRLLEQHALTDILLGLSRVLEKEGQETAGKMFREMIGQLSYGSNRSPHFARSEEERSESEAPLPIEAVVVNLAAHGVCRRVIDLARDAGIETEATAAAVATLKDHGVSAVALSFEKFLDLVSHPRVDAAPAPPKPEEASPAAPPADPDKAPATVAPEVYALRVMARRHYPTERWEERTTYDLAAWLFATPALWDEYLVELRKQRAEARPEERRQGIPVDIMSPVWGGASLLAEVLRTKRQAAPAAPTRDAKEATPAEPDHTVTRILTKLGERNRLTVAESSESLVAALAVLWARRYPKNKVRIVGESSQLYRLFGAKGTLVAHEVSTSIHCTELKNAIFWAMVRPEGTEIYGETVTDLISSNWFADLGTSGDLIIAASPLAPGQVIGLEAANARGVSVILCGVGGAKLPEAMARACPSPTRWPSFDAT